MKNPQTITYNIRYFEDGQRTIELDQKSKENLDPKASQLSSDIGIGIVNGIMSGVETGTKKVLEYAGAPSGVQRYHNMKLGSINIGVDYMSYLADQRKSHGEVNQQDYIIAAAKTLGGYLFGIAGASAGGSFGPVTAVSGAITMSIIYDTKEIGGKTSAEWVEWSVRKVLNYDKPAKVSNDLLVVNGFNEEQVAKAFNVPMHNVIENKIDALFDGPSMLKSFTIDTKTACGIGESTGCGLQSAFSDYKARNQQYTVRSGDTVWQLAKQRGVSVDELVSMPGNEFLKENRFQKDGKDYILIKPGQTMVLPAISDPNSPTADKPTKNIRDNTRIEKALDAFEYAATFKSPLVLDLDGDGIELSHVFDNSIFFDIDDDNHLEKIGWVKPDDAHLAIDTNGNGRIDDITELYGDDLRPAFKKLGIHDSNQDGIIDKQDEDFVKILVWRDLNQNAVSEQNELKSLAETEIVSISLDEKEVTIYNQDNLITGTSVFTYQDGRQYTIADVHYVNDKANSWYVEKGTPFNAVTIDMEVLSLPNSRGYGTLASLHIAMSQNTELFEMVKEFSNLPSERWNELLPRIENILFEWAGSTYFTNAARFTSGQNNFGANKVGFLERFTGQEYKQLGNRDLLGAFAQRELHKAFAEATYNIKMNLLVQGPLKDIFKHNHKREDGSIFVSYPRYKVFTDTLEFDVTQEDVIQYVVKMIHNSRKGFMSPDLLHSLINIVFDEDNNIRFKDFSFEKLFQGVLKGHQVEGIMSLIERTLVANQNRLGEENVVAELTAKVMEQVWKIPTDEKEFETFTSFILEHDCYEILNRISINEYIAQVMRAYAAIPYPSENQNKSLFETLLKLNNLLAVAEAYMSPLELLTKYSCNDIKVLTNGSDDIDIRQDKNVAIGRDEGLLIYARDGDDMVQGGICVNVIFGENGNDWLQGELHDDIIYGDDGNDFLIGGGGKDKLYGGSGDDYIEGQSGADYMDGGDGDDTLSYIDAGSGVNVNLATGAVSGSVHAQNYEIILCFDPKFSDSEMQYIDWIVGILIKDGKTSLVVPDKKPLKISSSQEELLLHIKDLCNSHGRAFFTDDHRIILDFMLKKNYISKSDVFVNFENIGGTFYDDILIGDSKDNFINGEDGDDYIEGGDGDDSLFGSGGRDALKGGKGDDRLTGAEGGDIMNGEEGFDTLNYSSYYETEGVYVNLMSKEAKGGHAEGDKFINIEALIGTRFDDVLIGDKSSNILRGGAGDDVFLGNGGDDIFLGEGGQDIYIIRKGQEGEVNIPVLRLWDRIVFIEFSASESDLLREELFSKFGITYGTKDMECVVISAHAEYKFALGHNQSLQINGSKEDYSLSTAIICPSNFEFYSFIEEMDASLFKGYEIFT